MTCRSGAGQSAATKPVVSSCCDERESNMAASMLAWLKRFYCFLLMCPHCIPAFLNLEELNEMKYGIEILSAPVMLGQVG